LVVERALARICPSALASAASAARRAEVVSVAVVTAPRSRRLIERNARVVNVNTASKITVMMRATPRWE
jgi:hypothetical protein